VKSRHPIVYGKHEASTGNQYPVYFFHDILNVGNVVQNAEAVDYVKGLVFEGQLGRIGLMQADCFPLELEISRRQLEVVIRYVHAVTICASACKLHQIGALADADLKNLLPGRLCVGKIALGPGLLLEPILLDR
jgi:hypothetical protein